MRVWISLSLLLLAGPMVLPVKADGKSSAPAKVFRDCAVDCPQMVVIPPGKYMMGSAADDHQHSHPQHPVTIGYTLAVGKYDVTRGEFAAFVRATGHKTKVFCKFRDEDGFIDSEDHPISWDRPGFPQTDKDPVVCVAYEDAQAYANWLSAKTGHQYRLLSEAEWEYAARAGTNTRYYWGDEFRENYANCRECGSKWTKQQTSPSGMFLPNKFGLYDMIGNVWQLVSDCFYDDYSGAPSNGAPSKETAECARVVRGGGSWNGSIDGDGGGNFDIADRYDIYKSENATGFRVARTF